MLNFWTKTGNWPIGLDYSDDGVRMLQFRQGKSATIVTASAHWAPPARSLDSADLKELTNHAIREILKDGQFSGRDVISTIESPHIHTGLIRLPADEAENLGSKSFAQKAQRAMKLDINDAQITLLRAGTVVRDEKMPAQFIMLATPKSAIKARTKVLQEMGFKNVILEPEPLAIYRAFRRTLRRHSDTVSLNAIIKPCKNHTTIVVGQGTRILFVKSIDKGWADLNKAAADSLGLSSEDIILLRKNVYKQSRNLDSQTNNELLWSIYDAIRPEGEKLAFEVELCLRYCQNTFGCPPIDNLTLIGSQSNDLALRKILESQLKLKTQVAWPMRNLDMSSTQICGDRRTPAAEWTTCVGLAGKNGFNERYNLQNVKLAQLPVKDSSSSEVTTKPEVSKC